MTRILLLFFIILFTDFGWAQSLLKPKLAVTPLTNGVYVVHNSYSIYQKTPVPSNGLIIKTSAGIVLVDTGWDTKGDTDNTRQLLQWVADSLHQQRPAGIDPNRLHRIADYLGAQ